MLTDHFGDVVADADLLRQASGFGHNGLLAAKGIQNGPHNRNISQRIACQRIAQLRLETDAGRAAYGITGLFGQRVKPLDLDIKGDRDRTLKRLLPAPRAS